MSTGAFFKFPMMMRRLHAGPLSVHIDAYAALLQKQGYARQSARVHLQVLADFSRWLQRRELGEDDIDAQTLQRYLRCRGRFVDRHRGASSALNKFLGMLHDRGIAKHDTPPVAIDPCERVEEDFKQYLSQERGLSVAILHIYVPVVHLFLRERFDRGPIQFLELCATDLTGFVQRHVHEHSPRTAQHMVAALRAFLRYLRFRGEITTDLAACVPTVANWSYSTLPKFLQPGQVQQVFARCDRRIPVGRRNYAILLLLARLGLRAGELGIFRGSAFCRKCRIRHLRHTMAAEVLRRCYRAGADPERRLPALSTYLGHTHLNYTYWYLHQNPSLMTEAMARLQHRWEAPA